MAISLYTSRLVLKELGVEDFGIYNVIGGFVALLSVISGSLSAAMSRFYTFELGLNDIGRLKRVFSTSISVLLILAIVIFIIGELAGKWALNDFLVIPETRLNTAFVVLQASIIAFVFNLLSSPFSGAIIAYEKMKAFAYLGIADAFGRLFIALSLQLAVNDKLVMFSILQTLLSLIILFFYIIYCKFNLEGCTLSLKLDKEIFYSLSKYATWSMLGMMSYVSYTYGYNIILNIFFGPIVNAARGVSVQVQNAIVSFANNFQASLNPQIIKNYANGNLERMHELVLASSRYSFYMMLLIALPLILEADTVLDLWLVEIPPHAISFVRIVLFTMCIEVLAGPMICSQNATGDIKKFQIVTSVIMLCSLPVCYWAFEMGLSPEYLYWIYALFTIITQIARVAITCPYIGIPIKRYLSDVVTNIVVVSLLSLPIPLCLYYFINNDTFQLIIVIISSIITVLGSTYFFGMKEQERLVTKMKLIGIRQKYLG